MEIGGLETIYTSPIAVFLIVGAVLALAVPRIRTRMKARKAAASATEETRRTPV